MIAYRLGESGQRLVFTRTVLDHFRKHRQDGPRKREAGGQIFARLRLPDILLQEVTGPRARDQRTRVSYLPDRTSEQREIYGRHRRGLHFIGDWHTHPEDVPSPSGMDISSIQDAFSKSCHSLNGFILVIVGRCPFPSGLSVSFCNRTSIIPLSSSAM